MAGLRPCECGLAARVIASEGMTTCSSKAVVRAPQ
jgi:hypothetical protein